MSFLKEFWEFLKVRKKYWLLPIIIVLVLFLLILSKSFPNKRIIKPIGVTTIKNTAPITIGDTIEPKRIPNLNHSLFNGVKNLEFKTPKTKKTKDKIKAHNLKSP